LIFFIGSVLEQNISKYVLQCGDICFILKLPKYSSMSMGRELTSRRHLSSSRWSNLSIQGRGSSGVKMAAVLGGNSEE